MPYIVKLKIYTFYDLLLSHNFFLFYYFEVTQIVAFLTLIARTRKTITVVMIIIILQPKYDDYSQNMS